MLRRTAPLMKTLNRGLTKHKVSFALRGAGEWVTLCHGLCILSGVADVEERLPHHAVQHLARRSCERCSAIAGDSG